jgi:AcrR family transcriptional regulator
MRTIGEAAGIRGPSIYHHFPSKDAIVEELLGLSMDASRALAQRLAHADADAAVSLYRMILFDSVYLYTLRFDFRGLYNYDLLAVPAFSVWRDRLHQMRADIRSIVEAGVRSGRFVDVDSGLVQEAISALVLRSHSMDGVVPEDPDAHAEAVARFVLQGILVRPQELPQIADEARLFLSGDLEELGAASTSLRG